MLGSWTSWKLNVSAASPSTLPCGNSRPQNTMSLSSMPLVIVISSRTWSLEHPRQVTMLLFSVHGVVPEIIHTPKKGLGNSERGGGRWTGKGCSSTLSCMWRVFSFPVSNCYAEESIAHAELLPHSLANRWRPISTDELWLFFGVVFAVGLMDKLGLQSYWSSEEVIRTPFFENTMTRDHFLLIWSFFISTTITMRTEFPVDDKAMILCSRFARCIKMLLWQLLF